MTKVTGMAGRDGSGVWTRELEELWSQVAEARAVVAAQRLEPRNHPGTAARQALILALEAYLGLIIERGYPAPYGLTNELNMQRRVCRWISATPPGM